MSSTQRDLTLLILQWREEGEECVVDRLLPILYDELRRLAQGYISAERSGHTLEPTALVHEAYLRLVELDRLDWRGRAHFLGLAARVMRQVLVDHARRHRAAKRGGGGRRVTLDDAAWAPEPRPTDVLKLEEALRELQEVDPEKCRIVELRFFGGLTVEETAEVLGVSPRTVKRGWRAARTWLARELSR